MTKWRWTILLAAILLGTGLLWLFLGREPIQEGRCRLIRKKANLSNLMPLAARFLEPLDGRPESVQDLPGGFEQPAYYEIGSGDTPIPIVVDFSKDLRLCIDTDGDRILSEERCFPAKPAKAARTSDKSQLFGPICLASHDGDGFYVKCHRPDAPAMLIAYPAVYHTGKLRLAGETYRVAVADGDSDGSYHSILSLSLDALGRVSTGDVFAIDLNRNGRFEIAAWDWSETMLLGKLVRIADDYYAIDVAPDGASLSLSKTEPQFGTLALEPNGVSVGLKLWSDATEQCFSQGRTWQLPAGKYRAIHASLAKADASGKVWTVLSSSRAISTHLGQLECFNIEPGETTSIRVGPPFIVKTDVEEVAGGQASIGMVLVGCGGEEWADILQVPGCQWPPAFKIVDDKGTVLVTDKFQYGRGGVCRYSWRVPDGFKGKFQIQIEADLGPFEVIQERSWHSVE